MNDDAPRTPSDGPLELNLADFTTGDVYEDAITDVVRLILELASTNQALDYAGGARIRVALENSLRGARHTFEAMPDGPTRARALHRLDGLRIAAERQLRIAPPGEPSASPREVEERKAQRLGHGSSSPRPLRRPRSDTRPETPGAMSNGARDTDQVPSHQVASHETALPVIPAGPLPEKEQR